MKRYSIKSKIIICIALILVVIANFFSLAKYRSVLSSYSSGNVAKWYNNIEIVSNDEVILDNNEINSESLTFNVLSSSEVSSKFDIGIDEVPEDIKLTLSNANKSASVIVSGSSIEISIGLDEEEFTIPNSNATTTVGNITMTSTTLTGGVKLTFTKSNELVNVVVTIITNSDTYDTLFNNFGTINYGDNQSVSHTLVFSTDAIQLPGISELELYAVLEQID